MVPNVGDFIKESLRVTLFSIVGCSGGPNTAVHGLRYGQAVAVEHNDVLCDKSTHKSVVSFRGQRIAQQAFQKFGNGAERGGHICWPIARGVHALQMKYTALWRGEEQKRLTGFVAQMPPARQPHLGHGDIRGRGGHVCVGISAGGEGERVQIDALDQQPCRSKCGMRSGGGWGVFWMKNPQSECIDNPF